MLASDRVNILIVDDQPAKLMSHEAVLGELGENLIRANSAREALEQLLKHDIAVVLADVCMPDLDGFQLAEMIREHPRYQHTAIVFISAVQLDDYDRLRGYQTGAVDYVPVPIIPELLRAKVKVFAELYRKTRELEKLNRELEQRVAARTAELEASNARLELAMDLAGLATWDRDISTKETTFSDRCFSLLGYRPDEFEDRAEAWRSCIHPDDHDRVLMNWADTAELGKPYREVFRCTRRDGSTAWCEARAEPICDDGGRPHQLLGVIMDISEHKLAEERQRLMLQELHHRVKNSLTTVQSIASLSARTAVDMPTFYEAFSSRIRSLSRTHTILVSNNWGLINISDIAASELSGYDSDRPGRRIEVSGPPVELPSDIALSLGLACASKRTQRARQRRAPKLTAILARALRNGRGHRREARLRLVSCERMPLRRRAEGAIPAVLEVWRTAT